MPSSPYSTSFIEERRLDLVQQRTNFRAQLEHLNDPVEDGGDLADRTDVELARHSKADTHNRIMRELAEIDAALTRISHGSYGLCELTGSYISEERLVAIPTARYDINGQKKVERRQQKQLFLARNTPDQLFDD